MTTFWGGGGGGEKKERKKGLRCFCYLLIFSAVADLSRRSVRFLVKWRRNKKGKVLFFQ
jgi:hypothetical protein